MKGYKLFNLVKPESLSKVHNPFEQNSRAIRETRGIIIGSRLIKPIHSITLSKLNRNLSGVREISRNSWLAGKKSTSYRSVYDFSNRKPMNLKTNLAKRNPMEKVKTFNPFGSADQLSKLLVSKEKIGDVVRNRSQNTKAKIAASMKKASFLFAGVRLKRGERFETSKRQLSPEEHGEGMEQFEVEVEAQAPAPVENYETNQSSLGILESSQVDLVEEKPPVTADVKQKKQAFQQTPTDCLICEKLIHCSLRTEILTDSEEKFRDIAPCRLLSER